MLSSNQLLLQFRANLRVIERETANYLKNETACCGVSLSQCHILMELDAQGEMSLKQLAANLEADPSTLSRVIDGMVNSGLILRAANPDDRRAVILKLSEQGQRTAATINEQSNRFYQRLFELLPTEKHAQMVESITLLGGALSALRRNQPFDQQTCCAYQTEEQ